MIQQQPFTRNTDERYVVLTGTDEATGEAPTAILPQQPGKSKMQPYELVLQCLTVECDPERKGTPTRIVTVWQERHYDNAGNLIAGYTRPVTHITRADEMPLFIARFLPLLQPSIYNGAIRGGDNEGSGLLGQNNCPLFDALGAIIPDSPENSQAAPTWDYNAPQNPAADENPVSA